MAGLSIWHVIIFAIVVLLLFGTSKLKNLGKDVGGAVRDFKKTMREEEQAQLAEPKDVHEPASTSNTEKASTRDAS